jgi:hypothetical protein
VLVYTIFVNIIRWSIGYNIMKPEVVCRKNSKTDETSGEIITGSYNKIVMSNEPEHLEINNEDRESHKQEKSFCELVSDSINMPFIAGVAAIVLASIPYVGDYLSKPDSYAFNLLVSN